MEVKKKIVPLENNKNKKLSDEFDLLIKCIKYKIINSDDKDEIKKLNFKLKHYKNALIIIRNYNNKIKSGEDLKDITGIGKGIITRINEILENKKLGELNEPEMKKIINEVKLIDELTNVINIGSKVAKNLITEHNIKSLKDLKNKVKKGEIVVNDKIKMGLKYHNIIKENIPRSEMDLYNKKVISEIKKVDKKLNAVLAGSYRRGYKTSNDIDILITHNDIKTQNDFKKNDSLLHQVVGYFKANNIIIDDLTGLTGKTKYMGFSKLNNYPVRRMDIRFVPTENFPSALLYFTGPYFFNSQMRLHAKNLGYKLNEYGLFKIKNGKSSKKSIKINTENDIFKILDLPYLEPTKRG